MSDIILCLSILLLLAIATHSLYEISKIKQALETFIELVVNEAQKGKDDLL